MAEPETNVEYHADISHVGSSMLSEFRNNGPAWYHAVYVAQTLPRPKPTPQMVLGSATHTLVLEPSRWDAEYVVAPDGVSRRQKKWETLVEMAEAEGRTPLLAEEAAAARAMADSLLRNEYLQVLLEASGTTERSIRWTDDRSGIKCKCRPDRLIDDFGLSCAWLLEIKSSVSPGADFGKACANFGYDRQMAHYLEGAHMVTDRPLSPYMFVVRNTQPYDVWPENNFSRVEFIEPGFRSRRYWLSRLAECIKTDEWVAPEQKRPGLRKLPAWHLKGEEYD
jgi:exodeoxyribonuclease VIII